MKRRSQKLSRTRKRKPKGTYRRRTKRRRKTTNGRKKQNPRRTKRKHQRNKIKRNKQRKHKNIGKQPIPRKPLRNYQYNIAIPSYHRLDTFAKKTYEKVIKPHKLEDRVILFLQNDEDEKDYHARFPKLKIVRSPPGYHDTLNYISRYFPLGKHYVKMDDDLSGFFTVKDGFVEKKGKLLPVKNVDKMFQKCFREMDLAGANLGGFYPSASWFRGPRVSRDLRFIIGACYCVRNQKIFLPEDNTKSDFELTIKYYQRDCAVVRMNRYGFRTSYAAKGGIERTLKSENRDNERLFRKYPKFVKRSIRHKNGTTSLVLIKNACVL